MWWCLILSPPSSANMANALTMGMQAELKLSAKAPNIALAVFFVPYILLEVPSNFILKKMTPHVWLSLCIAGFGLVMLCQGFVQSYGGLLATRFLLGVFEAGIFPGSFYLISFWYERREAMKRFTLYFTSVIVASAVGGLLASGIARMNGDRGLSNWRWVFILEGILTVLVAAASFFFVCDFPDQAGWLTAREKRFILAKTRQDTGSEKLTRGDFVRFFKDAKNYLGALMYFCEFHPGRFHVCCLVEHS